MVDILTRNDKGGSACFEHSADGKCTKCGPLFEVNQHGWCQFKNVDSMHENGCPVGYKTCPQEEGAEMTCVNQWVLVDGECKFDPIDTEGAMEKPCGFACICSEDNTQCIGCDTYIGH